MHKSMVATQECHAIPASIRYLTVADKRPAILGKESMSHRIINNTIINNQL